MKPGSTCSSSSTARVAGILPRYDDPVTPRWVKVTPITDLTERLSEDLSRLVEAKSAADSVGNAGERAEAYADKVKPLLGDVRASIDNLEGLVDDKIWPLPKYRELLFLR